MGIFALGAERNLGFIDFDNGNYGFETIALSYNGSGGPSIDHQIIASIATDDYHLGSLGLSPQQIEFGGGQTSPSYLSNLKNQSKIPSLSFGYSAGAPYRNP